MICLSHCINNIVQIKPTLKFGFIYLFVSWRLFYRYRKTLSKKNIDLYQIKTFIRY